MKAKRAELANKTEVINQIKGEIDDAKKFLDFKAEEKTKNALTQQLHPGINSHADGFDDPQHDNADIIDE